MNPLPEREIRIGNLLGDALDSLWAKPSARALVLRTEPASRLGPSGDHRISRRKVTIEWSGHATGK
jgi:hypothetical protein